MSHQCPSLVLLTVQEAVAAEMLMVQFSAYAGESFGPFEKQAGINRLRGQVFFYGL